MSHLVNEDFEIPAADNPYVVRAVLRVLDIFDLLKRSLDGVSFSEIVAVTGLPKSSAFRYLSTLEARSYVERDPDRGTYRLGLAFFPVEGRHLEVFAARVRPYVEELRDRLNETINLGVLRGNLVTYIEVAESRQPIHFSAQPGSRNTVHSTALGKAIAAQLPQDDVRRILASAGMTKKTLRTITDPEDFINHLAEVRRRGFAVDNIEDDDDCRCVAVPVPGAPFPSAISLSAPSGRLPLSEAGRIAAALTRVAHRIGDELAPTDAVVKGR